MRLLALCLSTFLTFLIAINADQSIPSFLKFVGSYKYNTTEDGKATLKRYYWPHRITYKWIDAFMVCKSIGMRMALIETDDELNNLIAMARRNSKIFDEKVFVDGYDLAVTESDSNGTDTKPCYSIQKLRKGKLKIHSENCNYYSNKFLCEQTEIVDICDYEKNHASDDIVDVKATFFKYIGNFESKKYYASFQLKAQSNDVPKICQSFGMQMVSPRNQAEYDNLVKMLEKFDDEWNSVSIAGYRTDDEESEWVVFGEKVSYEMDWKDGQPDNRDDVEHCIALKKMDEDPPKIEDIPCRTERYFSVYRVSLYQFVCELDESITDVKILSQIDPRIFKPLTNYEIGSTKKELFVSLFDVDWITAHLMCRNFGMELFTPSSSTEDETLRNKMINFTGISDVLHVGITSAGTDGAWYSVNTGKILDFDLEYANQYYASDYNSLTLSKTNESYAYDTVTITNIPHHFICQMVVEG
ncbi:hypothetical protein HA402_008457 [Bradysia odoriphaga]|nr:hypothetical protein HA402_008457 [Bradysia odoriphaga]